MRATGRHVHHAVCVVDTWRATLPSSCKLACCRATPMAPWRSCWPGLQRTDPCIISQQGVSLLQQGPCHPSAKNEKTYIPAWSLWPSRHCTGGRGSPPPSPYRSHSQSRRPPSNA